MEAVYLYHDFFILSSKGFSHKFGFMVCIFVLLPSSLRFQLTWLLLRCCWTVLSSALVPELPEICRQISHYWKSSAVFMILKSTVSIQALPGSARRSASSVCFHPGIASNCLLFRQFSCFRPGNAWNYQPSCCPTTPIILQWWQFRCFFSLWPDV